MNSEKQRLLDGILTWAKSASDVRAVALIGSEARSDGSSDEWSDLDLVLVVRDPALYLSSHDWLADIGAYTLHTVERAPDGKLRERRVIFSNGIDVDLIILPAESCRQGLDGTWIGGSAQQGMKTFLDKDGVLPPMIPSPSTAQPAEPPTLPEFQEVISDFWFHVVWTAKKLMRGELWTAKFCCDVYMKRLLLRMVEWHARATAGWDVDVRYGGRFLEQWADSSIVTELGHVFSRYDEDDIWRALFATGNLFRRIAEETAQQLSYDWLAEQGQEAMEWAGKCQFQRASVSTRARG